MNPAEFISRLAPIAMRDMLETNVPASITIAQAILESAWGESGLTKQANNLFGIKGTGPAGSIVMTTKEFVNGNWILVQAPFRAYHNWAESVSDHSNLILHGTNNAPARYHGVLGADYKTAAYAVWRGGYATDPQYPQKLIQLIETYELWKFDDRVREERRMLEEMKAQLQKLAEDHEQLKQRVAALESRQSMQIPEWARKAVDAAVQAKLVDTPEGGSYDFYRLLTVLYRKGLL